MSMGLLNGLMDSETRAEISERSRIIKVIADQMGVSRREAADKLFHFEVVTTSVGQTIH
jgi:hypothetical protein